MTVNLLTSGHDIHVVTFPCWRNCVDSKLLIKIWQALQFPCTSWPLAGRLWFTTALLRAPCLTSAPGVWPGLYRPRKRAALLSRLSHLPPPPPGLCCYYVGAVEDSWLNLRRCKLQWWAWVRRGWYYLSPCVFYRRDVTGSSRARVSVPYLVELSRRHTSKKRRCEKEM